jgi:hypothetical protein
LANILDSLCLATLRVVKTVLQQIGGRRNRSAAMSLCHGNSASRESS